MIVKPSEVGISSFDSNSVSSALSFLVINDFILPSNLLINNLRLKIYVPLQSKLVLIESD